jgi:hypothetical protein
MIQVTQKNNLKLSAMANLDQFNIKQFTTKELKQFGLIRLAFNKKDLDTAKEIIPILKNK